MFPTKALDKFKDGWPQPNYQGGLLMKEEDRTKSVEKARTPADFFNVQIVCPALPRSFQSASWWEIMLKCQINEIKNSAKITLPSTFCLKTLFLQPLDGFLPHCTHTTLRLCRCTFWGSWPLTYFMTYDLGQNNFAVNISLLDCTSATPWWIPSILHTYNP